MNASRVEVINLNKAYRVNGNFIKRIVRDILKFIGKGAGAQFEIVFLDDHTIRIFNKRYKGRDRPTDVLSFKIDGTEFGEGRFLGEILISSERAFKNARVFGTDFEEELVLYVIHGILHLFGYDDESPRARGVMAKKEKEALGFLCRKEGLSKVLIPR